MVEKRIEEIPDIEERAKCKSMRDNSHVSYFPYGGMGGGVGVREGIKFNK